MSSNSPLADPATWVVDHLADVQRASKLGPVLDLASGRGRNALYLGKQDVPVIAMDRNPDHLRELAVHAARAGSAVTPVRCDLETEHEIPLNEASCGAILVFRFLFRPLAPAIERALRPGGVLLYETFSISHHETGRGPRSEAFYLDRDELPALFPNLEVISHEEGPSGGEGSDITSRLFARKAVGPR